MDRNKPIAALFDLDGVVFDTESQYSIFWGEQGRKYHPELPHFEQMIKGQTLAQIFGAHFADNEAVQAEIRRDLSEFEHSMRYEYVPGVEEYLDELKRKDVRTAVVTSSDEAKMACVYGAHPHFRQQFDRVLVAEMFAHSKPHPDCYLLGARTFGTPVENCVVFEDSVNGLKAGRAAKMLVVGLSTTNTPEAISPLADYVMPDFKGFTFEKMHELLTRFQ